MNGQPISQTVYNAFVAEQKAQGAPDSPELQNAVKEELVRREILAQEAKKKGMDKNPNIQGQIELAKQAVLIRAYLSDYVKANPISEAQLKAEYDVIKNNLGSTEYKSRHVLVEKEEEAKKQGYDKFCQNEKKECGNDAQGYPKFCYQIPALVCPAGCVCMSKEEAVAKGLKDNCLDAMGNPIVCGVIDTGNGLFRYCFKNPEQVMCQYDYKLERCVGDCSAGKKCQLNTIYRDPKTGKVIRAECHCK